jgi:hypothetical protein
MDGRPPSWSLFTFAGGFESSIFASSGAENLENEEFPIFRFCDA